MAHTIKSIVTDKLKSYCNFEILEIFVNNPHEVNKCENKEYGNSNVPVESFKKTLTNHVIELRISAFSFLIYGKKTATVFSQDQLDLTKIAIKANMNLHKPLYRQQFSSVMKILLQRFDLRKVFDHLESQWDTLKFKLF